MTGTATHIRKRVGYDDQALGELARDTDNALRGLNKRLSDVEALLLFVRFGTSDPNGTVLGNAGDVFILRAAGSSAFYLNKSLVNPGAAWSLVTVVP